MSWFSNADRAVLRAVADVLIPEAEGMPSASSVEAADDLLDQVLNFRPDLAPDILRGLRTLAGADPRTAITCLRKADEASYAALTLALAAAYYMAPAVGEQLGYTGPKRAPLEADVHELNALLQPVITRGAIWRRPA